MDQAASFFQERRNRKNDGDEIFGKNVACSLRKIENENLKEHAKLKIQQILFEAHCGETRNLFQFQDLFIPSTTPVRTPLTAPLQTPQRSSLFIPLVSNVRVCSSILSVTE